MNEVLPKGNKSLSEVLTATKKLKQNVEKCCQEMKGEKDNQGTSEY